MKYRTAKQLALIWLKVKLMFWLALSAACVSVGVYFFTGWGIPISVGIGVVVMVVLFLMEDHPETEEDRAVMKYPVSEITDWRYQKTRPPKD